MRKLNPSLVWAGHTAAGYATCLALSTWLPLGLHRVVMRRAGWWLFPALSLLGAAGAAGFLYVSHSPAWAFLVAPYMLLLLSDVLSLWSWAWPFNWTPADKMRELNARYSVSLHLSTGLVLAVLLWLGVHHG